MPPLTRRRLLPLCALALALTGCGLVAPGEDQTVDVRGRVVAAGTQAPLAGLGVMLDQGNGSPARSLIATTRTDARGAFRIVYEADERNPFDFFVTINDEPYDARYSVSGGSVPRGEPYDFGTVELRLNEGP